MKLNFKKLGKGQPLIILHGLFGSLDNWMTLAKKWSEEYEIWLVDLRNHGQSPHSNDFSYELMAQDLLGLIEENEIELPHILGHSMGGKTAMEFAVKHSEKLAKLIVVDIAPVKYQVHHYEIIDALESVDFEEISSRKEADEQLSSKIKENGVRQFLLKNLYWKEEGVLAWRFNLPVLKKEILPISEWNIPEGKFENQTLFIKGKNSNYILPQHAAEIEARFPDYKLEEIDNAGHWVHAEAPTAFSEVVLGFLKN
jgi:pimeloyl-ACP methyl ester carboxylesterase